MNIEIRPLQQSDLPEADRIFRLAFGTFLALPDPMQFAGDANYVGTRWRAAPQAALGAYAGDALVGSNFATRWGSFGFFGPLTVLPRYWGQGVAQQLLAATMDIFDRWGTRQSALFTFPHSPKHLGLYQKFGFWPQHLTAVMAKPVAHGVAAEPGLLYGALAGDARDHSLAACREVTEALYPGLDVGSEIEAVAAQKTGDTVLIEDAGKVVAFAVCHLGKGSEAGSGTAYIKFAAARPGADAAQNLERLLTACEALAAAHGLDKLLAGVNTARYGAYRLLLARGFGLQVQGVAMQSSTEPGYNRPDCFVIDDWR